MDVAGCYEEEVENGKPKAILRHFLWGDGRCTETISRELACLVECFEQLLFLHKAII